jgi:deoxyhypusine synthase
MPFIIKALLDKRKKYRELAQAEGESALFAREPAAKGFLRPNEGYRLYARRDALVQQLTEDVKLNRDWLLRSLDYGLARK